MESLDERLLLRDPAALRPGAEIGEHRQAVIEAGWPMDQEATDQVAGTHIVGLRGSQDEDIAA